jgi:membrane protease YdiL (CAAX protease family)
MQTIAVQPNRPSPFRAVRGRYIVLLWLLPSLLPLVPGFDDLVLAVGTDWPSYWWDIAYIWLHEVLFAGVLALLVVVIWRLPVAACWGRRPSRRELNSGLQLTAFAFVASMTLTYLTFYPLSFVAPDVVQRWYIDSYPPLLFYDYDSSFYPLLPNLLWVVSLCVVGPMLEEISFRAILLPRWTCKWGLPIGILASSAVFAVAHPDTFGALVFGVAMCILYLKSQSLTLPIVCHGLYNFTLWLLAIGDALTVGPEYVFTLEEFQASWPWGVGAAGVTAIWSVVYVRGKKSEVRWSLPVA